MNKWCANSDNMRENDVSISRINTSCRQRKEWGSFPRMPSFTGGAVFGPILNKSTVELSGGSLDKWIRLLFIGEAFPGGDWRSG